MTLPASPMKAFARPGVVLPLAVLLTCGVLTADAYPSEATKQRAAVSCTLNVPALVAISSPYVNPTHTLGADCAAAGVIDARWVAKRAEGAVLNNSYFNFDFPTSWAVFDTTNLTTWTWYPAGARTRGDATLPSNDKRTPSVPSTSEPSGSTVPQNTPTTDIRMASAGILGWVPADIHDSTYRFWVDAERYANTPHGFIKYAGATGAIQKRPEGSTVWSTAASFTTNTAGHFEIVLPAPTVKTYYRLAIYNSQYIFGSLNGGGGWINP